MVSWSDSPREQSESNGEDAVMEDGTETHQAEINKKIKAKGKLRKILANMPEEHRTLVYGDSFKSKMEALDDEKAALLAAKRQFLPLQSRIDKQKNFLKRVSKEIETKQKKRLEILQKWIEADQELEAANAEQMQAKQEMALLVAEQFAEKCKNCQSRESTVSVSHVRTHHHTPFSQCSNPFSRRKSMGCHGVSEHLMAAGATEEDVKKISQSMAQTVRTLETGIETPEPGPEAHSLPCEVVGSDEEFSNGMCVPGFSKVDTEGQEATKRSLPNTMTEKRRLAKKCKQEGGGL